MVNALVAYYSVTGNTRKTAEIIASELNADIEEIVDIKDRSSSIGKFISTFESVMKKKGVIKTPKKILSEYDIVFIGGPVWAFNLSPAVRTYLTHVREELPKVVFFTTMGGRGGMKVMKDMEKVCHVKPVARWEFVEKDVKEGDLRLIISKYLKQSPELSR